VTVFWTMPISPNLSLPKIRATATDASRPSPREITEPKVTQKAPFVKRQASGERRTRSQYGCRKAGSFVCSQFKIRVIFRTDLIGKLNSILQFNAVSKSF
jgi:hypothetical protein